MQIHDGFVDTDVAGFTADFLPDIVAKNRKSVGFETHATREDVSGARRAFDQFTITGGSIEFVSVRTWRDVIAL
ncbi:MAG: hypothetical protein ACLQF1_09275 [Methyloceanibacter sp.]